MSKKLICAEDAITVLQRCYCGIEVKRKRPITENERFFYFDVLQGLIDLPSAQTAPQWIPVSEAMPEESDGTVLVCMPNKFPYSEKEPFVNAKHNRQVETATYSQYSDTWHYTSGGVASVRPIAWMRLPDPWKGEEG